ncbi:MAG: hypothetical protein ACRC6V_04110 [Bacteroidales bacterium]
MKTEIYGIVDDPIGTVEVSYFPYPHKIQDEVVIVDELPDIVDCVIYEVHRPKSDTGDIIDLDELHARFEQAEFNKTRPLFKHVPEPAIEIQDYDNSIEITPEDLDAFYINLAKSTQLDVAQLKANLSSVLTYDHASAHIEAFVRDGLGVEGFRIDTTIKAHVTNAVYLKYITSMMKRIKLPKGVSASYINVIIDDMRAELDNKRKSGEFKSLIKRYKQGLDNPVGVVDAPESNVGKVKGYSR